MRPIRATYLESFRRLQVLYRIFRLISRYRHELRLRLCSHIPMRDSFMRAHAHATAQRALDFPALLRKNGFAILMFDFEVICF